MAAPLIIWSNSVSGDAESGGTLAFANVSAGSVGSVSTTYQVYNSTGANASECAFYLDDVSGVFVSSSNIVISYSHSGISQDNVTWAENKTETFPVLTSSGASDTNNVTLVETIEFGGSETVGTKQWKKVITYQYT